MAPLAGWVKPMTSGGNVHIYRPYDEFVYHGARTAHEIPTVSDLQLYLDLTRSGRPAAEQAARFREKVLGETGDTATNPSPHNGNGLC